MSPRLAYSRPYSDARKTPYDYQRQRDIMRGIPRLMSPYLSAPEQKVLDYVFSQSVDMNREFLLTSYEKIEHGDPGAKTNGTGYSKRQLQRIVGALEKRRFFAVKRTGRGLKITPNPDWKPGPDTPLASEKRKQAAKKAANIRRENNPPKPTLISTLWPHPQRGDTDVHSRGDTDVHSEGTWMSTTKDEARKEEARKEEADFRSPNGDREPVSPISNSSTSIRVRIRQRPSEEQTSSEKQETPPVPAAPPSEFSPEKAQADHDVATVRSILKPGAMEQTYRAAFENAYSDMPGVFPTKWTRDQLGVVNTAILKKWEGTPQEAHEFIEWAVQNFSLLRRQVFGWMKRPPAPVAPDIKFILRWHHDLLKAYQKRRQEEYIESFDDYEEREFKRLMVGQGMSRENALLKIAEDRAALRMREEVEAKKAEAAHLFRAAQIAEQAAARRPMGVHPRSEIAHRLRELETRLAAQPVNPDQPFDLIAALEEGERRARKENGQ